MSSTQTSKMRSADAASLHPSSRRSCPALKAAPSPRKIATATSLEPPSRPKTAFSSSIMSSESAFRFSGLAIVTIAIGPSRSRRVNCVDADVCMVLLLRSGFKDADLRDVGVVLNLGEPDISVRSDADRCRNHVGRRRRIQRNASRRSHAYQRAPLEIRGPNVAVRPGDEACALVILRQRIERHLKRGRDGGQRRALAEPHSSVRTRRQQAGDVIPARNLHAVKAAPVDVAHEAVRRRDRVQPELIADSPSGSYRPRNLELPDPAPILIHRYHVVRRAEAYVPGIAGRVRRYNLRIAAAVTGELYEGAARRNVSR